jgi:hypothetical protein
MASQPTVSLPKLVKPDDVIRASDFNKLRNAVMALARGGVAAIPISQSPDTKPNLWVSEPFKATDGTSNVVSVTAGYLTYQLLLKKDDTGGPLYYDTPTINDVSIESPDKENIAISGAGFIYMHCTTNNRGVPTMTPTIDFYATEQASVHHVPESEDYNTPAVDGDYYWQLAEIEAVPDFTPTQYRIKRRMPGDKFIPNQIDRIKNIGDGVKLYWGFDPSATNALHKLRTLANATESGGAAPLVKDLTTEADETVKIKALVAGTGITLSSGADSIEIAADGSGTSGGNLDLLVTDVYPIYNGDGVVNGFNFNPDYYLCWRNGLFIERTDTPPAHTGTLYTADVTYLHDST